MAHKNPNALANVLLPALLIFSIAIPTFGKSSATGPIKLFVNASRAPEKVLHAELEIPAQSGPLTLYYPKWMPADHSPDGPIANLVGLQCFARGTRLPWRRDLKDMYVIHLEVPVGAQAVTVQLDFLLSAPGPAIDFAASGSANLLILMWNEVLLYPRGRAARDISFAPSLRLPDGWKWNTSLPAAKQNGSTIDFAVVPLDMLIDSPVQAGRFTRVIPLDSGTSPPHEVDIASDRARALEVSSDLVGAYKRLVREAAALFASHHYRDYHFLLTLSDNVLPLGQEHHESSDDRVAERTLSDPNLRLLEAELFPHEFTHSWNGQYRRPAGLATPDFQEPMTGELLWVYEGLTDYLGVVLAARSGLWTPDETREKIASIASIVEHREGRSWRSLQDTADAAQILYFAPPEWASYRRGTDFYIESVLLWLDVDTTIRSLTHNARSIDDFCRSFFGGPEREPVIKTYDFEELTSALNGIVPNDWRSFLRRRLDATGVEIPYSGIPHSGWRLIYNDEPNRFLAAEEQVSGAGDFTASLGLKIRGDGTVQDVNTSMSAGQSGLCPYMKILAVNDQVFSVSELTHAVIAAENSSDSIVLTVSNTGVVGIYKVPYHGGPRQPHLDRIKAASDYLSDILKPLAGESPVSSEAGH